MNRLSEDSWTLGGCLLMGLAWIASLGLSIGVLALVIYIGALIVKSVMG